MPIKPIPLHKGMLADYSEVRIAEDTEVDEISSYMPKLIDCMVDENGYIHKRFGLSDFSDDLPAGKVHDIYHWKNKGVVVASCEATGNDLYTVTEAGVGTGRADLDEADFFNAATFVDWGDTLYFCVGDDIHKLDSSLAHSQLGDADIPATCENITHLDQYLITSKADTGEFHFSEVGTPETWGGDFATAEAEQDYLLRAEAKNQRLYLFGKRTIEIWYNDGVTPFVRSPQGIIHTGLRSPVSFTWSEYLQTFVWVQNPSQVFKLQGLQAIPLSNALSKYIETITLNSNLALRVYSATIEDYPLIFFHFSNVTGTPTVVYDLRSGLIYDWHYYNSGASPNARYDDFLGSCYTYIDGASDNYHVFGGTSGTYLWWASTRFKDDGGNAIRSLIRSPAIDRGYNDSWKYCKKLTFRLKRTADVAAGNPSSISLSVRYRDNGSVTWSTARTITCNAGAVGDTEYFARSTRWGRYKTRQWEIVIDDSVPCCLLPVLEEFDYT